MSYDYLVWTLRTYLRDWRRYGAVTAHFNLYVNLRAVVDPVFRAEYGGWDTRYRLSPPEQETR